MSSVFRELMETIVSALEAGDFVLAQNLAVTARREITLSKKQDTLLSEAGVLIRECKYDAAEKKLDEALALRCIDQSDIHFHFTELSLERSMTVLDRLSEIPGEQNRGP